MQANDQNTSPLPQKTSLAEYIDLIDIFGFVWRGRKALFLCVASGLAIACSFVALTSPTVYTHSFGVRLAEKQKITPQILTLINGQLSAPERAGHVFDLMNGDAHIASQAKSVRFTRERFINLQASSTSDKKSPIALDSSSENFEAKMQLRLPFQLSLNEISHIVTSINQEIGSLSPVGLDKKDGGQDLALTSNEAQADAKEALNLAMIARREALFEAASQQHQIRSRLTEMEIDLADMLERRQLKLPSTVAATFNAMLVFAERKKVISKTQSEELFKRFATINAELMITRMKSEADLDDTGVAIEKLRSTLQLSQLPVLPAFTQPLKLVMDMNQMQALESSGLLVRRDSKIALILVFGLAAGLAAGFALMSWLRFWRTNQMRIMSIVRST